MTGQIGYGITRKQLKSSLSLLLVKGASYAVKEYRMDGFGTPFVIFDAKCLNMEWTKG